MHRLALSAIFLASFAHAHGPAPTALELFLNSEGRVTLVHTNIGLASPKAEGGYRYLCPILWGEDDYFLGRSLDVFVSRLRKYLKADESVKIENVHGVGFRLRIP